MRRVLNGNRPVEASQPERLLPRLRSFLDFRLEVTLCLWGDGHGYRFRLTFRYPRNHRYDVLRKPSLGFGLLRDKWRVVGPLQSDSLYTSGVTTEIMNICVAHQH